MSRKPTRSDCVGCRDDFYNHNNMGMNMDSGRPECWSLKAAHMVSARDVPVTLPPPYTHIKPTLRPSCYKRSGEVRIAVRVSG